MFATVLIHITIFGAVTTKRYAAIYDTPYYNILILDETVLAHIDSPDWDTFQFAKDRRQQVLVIKISVVAQLSF